MITFLFDACALARRYFSDIGTANIDQICRYPGSRVVFPNLAYAETVSTIVSAYNAGLLDDFSLSESLHLLDSDVVSPSFTKIAVSDMHIYEAGRLLKKHKLVPRGRLGSGKTGMGGADAIYLAVALSLSREARYSGDRVILVTSDRALYQAAQDEPGLETFHFWTCQCSHCGHVRVPVKGRKNTCPVCGKVCDPCSRGLCDSTYRVQF